MERAHLLPVVTLSAVLLLPILGQGTDAETMSPTRTPACAGKTVDKKECKKEREAQKAKGRLDRFQQQPISKDASGGRLSPRF
jgi:hypothetical protein